MRLGVDFGTTNSAIALYDGSQLHTILADHANDNPYVMPSLLYIDRRRHVTVGARAAEAYLTRETGRPVRWRQREAGEIEITVASVASTGGDPIQFMQPVNVLVDDAANGRLIQSIKTALFNPRYEGTKIFNRFYRIDNLIGIILKELRLAAERDTGQACRQIVLGRPVRFSTSAAVDSRAEAILLKAAHLAGFTDVRLALEPVGVAYLYHRQSRERRTVLVFDFGGGTLDLSIARVGGHEPPEILATGGVQVGGDDLDRRIMESLLPHFGGGDDGVLPSEMSDKLLAWQTMPELSRPRYVEQIQRFKRNGHRSQMETLETLISRNIGFKLFKELERVKKQLSSEHSALLQFEFDAVSIQEIITRRRFDRMIARDIAHIDTSIDELLDTAGLLPQDIDVVLRTGGSSLVPAVRQLLASAFGEAKVETIDPLVSVTGGFAVIAHEYDQHSPKNTISPRQIIAGIRADIPTDHVPYTIEIGAKIYTDRDYVVNRIPPRLNRLPAIQTTNREVENTTETFLTFTLPQAARVYIGYEASADQLPHWLRSFTPVAMQIEIEDSFARIERTMRLYNKEFPPGTVTLGGNQAEGYEGRVITHYLVIVEPLVEQALPQPPR